MPVGGFSFLRGPHRSVAAREGSGEAQAPTRPGQRHIITTAEPRERNGEGHCGVATAR